MNFIIQFLLLEYFSDFKSNNEFLNKIPALHIFVYFFKNKPKDKQFIIPKPIQSLNSNKKQFTSMVTK
jgi:hypothetical protein